MTASASSSPGAPGARPFRMRDLCEMTGLSRQAIHFYIQQGLVPEGEKTGRNMAWYGPAHVERLRLIRRLQEERMLPLKTIRAILDGQLGDGLPGNQRALLLEVRSRLPAVLGGQLEPATAVDALEAAERHGVSPVDVERLAHLGLIAVREVDGRRLVGTDSLWLLEAFGQLRALGFTESLGFGPDDLTIYDEAVTALFERETHLLLERLSHLPPDQVAPMVERVLPLIHTIFIHFHVAAVRNFFAALDGAAAARTEVS